MTESGNEKLSPVIRIVDDDKTMLRSWVFLLRSKHWDVRAYSDATEFLDNDDFAAPGCVLLDIRMPKMSGFELQELMQVRGIGLPIVFITGHGDVEMAVHAFKHGACDFLQKPVDEQRLVDALSLAIEKNRIERAGEQAVEDNHERFLLLTAREKEVVSLVVKGLMNKVIADKLGISERTVQIHRGVACRKLQVRTAVDLLRVMQSIGAVG